MDAARSTSVTDKLIDDHRERKADRRPVMRLVLSLHMSGMKSDNLSEIDVSTSCAFSGIPRAAKDLYWGTARA